MLRKAGLLHATAAGMTAVRAQAVAEGGTAFIYLNDSAAPDQTRQAVIQLFAGKEGIAEVIMPDRFAALGLPMPANNKHMADLILAARDDYAFSDVATGDEEIRPAILGVSCVGNHGYLNTNPKMNAIFIASGRDIHTGVKIGLINNTSVAPTAAQVLGLQIPGAEGRTLVEILLER